jgi:O-antigen ligase
VAVLLTAMVALLLTLSRSGWLAFTLALPIIMILLLLHPASRRDALPISVATIGVGLLGALVAAPEIIRRFTQSDPGATDFRWEWMGVAWGMVKDHWLLGVGLNSFVLNLPGRTLYGGHVGLIERFGANWPVVHNIYLLTWAEQGTLGFACFIALLLTLLWTGWRNARDCTDPWLHALSIGALAGICANLVDGLGSFYLRQTPGSRVFWMAAAIIVAVRYWQRANAPRQEAQA